MGNQKNSMVNALRGGWYPRLDEGHGRWISGDGVCDDIRADAYEFNVTVAVEKANSLVGRVSYLYLPSPAIPR